MGIEQRAGSERKKLNIRKTVTPNPRDEKAAYDDGIVGRRNAETKTCSKCGRLFMYMGFGHLYCPQCKSLDEANFEKVRSYIYEHGVASALEVSDNTGVSIRQIEQYLREGRLEIPENSPIFIKCEMCQTDIRSGRVCGACALKLSNAMRIEMDLDEFEIGEKPKKSGKMRFFNSEEETISKLNKQR